MYTINRWDPFREMFVVRHAMDRLVDNFVTGETSDYREQPTWSLALDVAENMDEYVVTASLPGVKPEDVDVTFSENVLTIKGELHAEEANEDSRWHLRERRYGSFTRSLTLPRGIQGDAIEASYTGGVLTLRLPKAEEIKPKRITVHSGETAKMIEGKVAEIATKN